MMVVLVLFEALLLNVELVLLRVLVLVPLAVIMVKL